MSVEGKFLFLESGPLHVTDVAEVFFILLQCSVFLSQTSKGVQHNTRNNVGEHSPEENAVDGIIGETGDFKGLHSLSNGSRNIQLQNTVEHGLAAVLLGLVATEDVFHVVAEGDGAEDEGEEHSHEADIDQL